MLYCIFLYPMVALNFKKLAKPNSEWGGMQTTRDSHSPTHQQSQEEESLGSRSRGRADLPVLRRWFSLVLQDCPVQLAFLSLTHYMALAAPAPALRALPPCLCIHGWTHRHWDSGHIHWNEEIPPISCRVWSWQRPSESTEEREGRGKPTWRGKKEKNPKAKGRAQKKSDQEIFTHKARASPEGMCTECMKISSPHPTKGVFRGSSTSCQRLPSPVTGGREAGLQEHQ